MSPTKKGMRTVNVERINLFYRIGEEWKIGKSEPKQIVLQWSISQLLLMVLSLLSDKMCVLFTFHFPLLLC